MSSLEILRAPDAAPLAISEERSLAQAFASFTEAASSLERCYLQLQEEVARLREELEKTNEDLAESLEENRRTREHLRRILEGLPCGVLVTEPGGRVSITNPEAQRLLGTSREGNLSPRIRQLIEEGDPKGNEKEYRRPDGLEEWISIRRAQLTREDGNSSIFILQDVTELKQLQQEHELFRRRQALAEMSALLAHEIRNPLGSMELFAGLLAQSELSAEQQEWISHLLAGLRTLGATVNNVLHFHSATQLQMRTLDPQDLLDWLAAFLQPLAARSKVNIVLRADLEGVAVAADRHRLEQVLLNLGLNALRFMADGGQLTITGSSSAEAVYLEVSDTGPGIAPELCKHIFQPGFTTNAGSPGLGLAVCKKIAEQHRGAIRVSSIRGRGTTFILELPRSCQ